MKHHLLLGVLTAIVPAIAHADAMLDEAKARLQTGVELYDENQFSGALVEFRRAYELAPSYKILFNIAQVEMMLQDYAAAFDAYTRYLDEGGLEISPVRHGQVVLELDRLRARVGFLVIQTAAGAEVFVNDMPVGHAPLPQPVVVAAGRQRVTVHIRGRDAITRAFDVAGRQTVLATLADDAPVVSSIERRPSTSASARAERDPGRSGNTPVYVAWSITGGLAIGAGVFALVARGDARDLAALRATYGVTAERLASQRSKTVRAAAVGDGFAAAAVASAGVALYVTLTRRRDKAGRARDNAVELQLAPDGVAIAGRF